MDYGQMKIDRYEISRITHNMKNVGEIALARALRWKEDKEAEKRREACLCKTCYYIYGSALAGQAFTQRPCGVCAGTITHSDTACPVICDACSKKTRLCKRCGGDRELRQRKGEIKFTVTVAPPPVEKVQRIKK